MTIGEATSLRVEELRKRYRLSHNALIYVTGLPPATVKSIINGVNKDPGIVSINKIANGLGITIREFYNSPMFDDLEKDD